jgi:hypothetical protein
LRNGYLRLPWPFRKEEAVKRLCLKFAMALAALTLSTHAYAMPEQVSDSWYSNMMFRLGVMNSNPGFCRAHPGVWVCWP